MAQEWHQTVVVRPGGRVEAVVPDLADGERVEVVVRRDGAAAAPGVVDGPRFGSARGRVFIREDFDAPLEDFQEYM